jgi:hypothetical protein
MALVYQTTRYHITENLNLLVHRHENLEHPTVNLIITSVTAEVLKEELTQFNV